MVNLERRVGEVEAVVEQRFEIAPRRVAVGVGGDQDVGGERREARGDLPDVEVVDLDDAGRPIIALPIASGSRPAGAASRKILPHALSRQ